MHFAACKSTCSLSVFSKFRDSALSGRPQAPLIDKRACQRPLWLHQECPKATFSVRSWASRTLDNEIKRTSERQSPDDSLHIACSCPKQKCQAWGSGQQNIGPLLLVSFLLTQPIRLHGTGLGDQASQQDLFQRLPKPDSADAKRTGPEESSLTQYLMPCLSSEILRFRL